MHHSTGMPLAFWLCPHSQAVCVVHQENLLRLEGCRMSIQDKVFRLHQRRLFDVIELPIRHLFYTSDQVHKNSYMTDEIPYNSGKLCYCKGFHFEFMRKTTRKINLK